MSQYVDQNRPSRSQSRSSAAAEHKPAIQWISLYSSRNRCIAKAIGSSPKVRVQHDGVEDREVHVIIGVVECLVSCVVRAVVASAVGSRVEKQPDHAEQPQQELKRKCNAKAA